MKKLVFALLLVSFAINVYAGNELTPKFAYKTKGLTATFTNKTIGEFESVRWDFGDGTSSTETNPTHQYTEKGMYVFTLTAINAAGEETAFDGKIYVFDTKSKKKDKVKEVKTLPVVNATPKANLTPATPSNVQIRKAYPNPFADNANIEFELTNASDVEVQLFDITGSMVQVINAGQKEAGSHQVTIERNDLPAGTYFAAIQTNMAKETIQLVIQ